MTARRITCETKTLIICINGVRFMARTSYEQGARHDFVSQDVRRNALITKEDIKNDTTK